MEKHYTKFSFGPALALAIGAIVLPVSCIDDNYDLSDIDTTTELKVNDLTIPVNFKEIYLEKIINLDESNPDAIIKIKEYNGKKYYCFSKGGHFDADPKSIAKVVAPAPDHIEGTNVQIYSIPLAPRVNGLNAPAETDEENFLEYTITPYSTDFTYRVGEDGNPKVDSAIKSVAEVGFDEDNPLVLSMTFNSEKIADLATHVEIYDLVLTVPDNTIAHYGDLTAKDGKITIPHLSTYNGEIELQIEVTGLNFISEAEPQGKAVVDGKFDFQEKVGVESGRFLVFPTATALADMPTEIDFRTKYDMTGFTVNSFSGVFDYAIDFDEIDPFKLSGIPTFLLDDQTNLILASPSLTLEVNSPVAPYGLECSTGLTLTAERSDAPAQSVVLDAFKLPAGYEKQYHILGVSEDMAAPAPTGFESFFTSFPGLSNVLSGPGLPEVVRVDFTSSQEPKPKVSGFAKKFPLGKSLDQVHGEYTFSAPLALANGSTIYYTTTVDGWNDEDVDAIKITSLGVTLKATSTIPAGAKIYIRPIDKQGKPIKLTNADTAFATLQPLAKDQEVSLLLLGDITHLDGIIVDAIVKDFNGQTLSPDYTIKVSDLRATVSGSYTKKL